MGNVEKWTNPYDDAIKSLEIQQEAQAQQRQVEEARNLFENQDMVRIIKTYLEEEIPQEIKQSRVYSELWSILGKKIQLTFLETDDLIEFEAMFTQAKMLYLMSVPNYQTDFKTLAALKQIEFHFKAAIRSAVGTERNKFNERIILGSTITQNIRSNSEQFGSSGSSGGLMNWVRKMF